MSGGGQVVTAESTTTTTTTEKEGGVIMQVHVLVVCSVVGLIGFVILILGVAAEAATAQAYVWYSFEAFDKCQYRTTPALGCGVIAALLAITAQVVVTATSLCCGCCRTWEVPTEPRRIIGIVLTAVSWVTVIIVVALFIAGAALNADQERRPNADDGCYLDPGSTLFAAATVLSVAATAMQIASYILLQVTRPPTSSTKTPPATQHSEVAMGQPAVVEPEPQQNGEEVGAQVPPAPSLALVPSQEATEPASEV